MGLGVGVGFDPFLPLGVAPPHGLESVSQLAVAQTWLGSGLGLGLGSRWPRVRVGVALTVLAGEVVE